jgi:Leucine-rich repeat (LRR) protein
MSGRYLSAFCVFMSAVLVSLAYGQGAAPKNESPYETVMRLRREAATKKTSENAAATPGVAGVEPKPGAQVDRSPRTHAGVRILHIPADRSLGKVMIRPAASGEAAGTFDWWIYGPEWEFIGQAQGDVAIPAEHEVSLSVWRPEGWRDLAPLQQLGPDDLYQLGIHGPETGGPGPGDSCMRYVAHLTGLRTLSLAQTNIGPAGMQHVAGLKELRYLVLPDRIDERGLAPLVGLTSLEGLSFGDNNITDATLEQVARLTSLTQLELGSEKVTEAGVAHLARLPRLERIIFRGKVFNHAAFAPLKDIKGLRVLCFRYLQAVTDADLDQLAGIAQLEDLNLFWCMNLTDAFLPPLQRLPHLRRLNIDHAKLTGRGLACLKEMKTLEALNLPCADVSDEGLQCLSGLPRVRELRVPQPHYADPTRHQDGYGDEGLKALSRLTALESLEIGSAAVTDRGIQHLATLTGLKKFSMFGCDGLTDESLRMIGRWPALENLSLSFGSLTISGLKALNSLTNLKTLDLHDITQDNSGLDWSGLTGLEDLRLFLKSKRVAGSSVTEPFRERDFAALGKLTSLRSLQLSHDGATDAALSYLIGLKRLEHLSLGGDGLTDQGLAHLAELPRLRKLTLSGHFTDKALEHLQRLPSLEALNFRSGACFSQAAVTSFQRRMPRLIVFRGFETDYARRPAQPLRPQRR